jgi:hypothetical protein
MPQSPADAGSDNLVPAILSTELALFVRSTKEGIVSFSRDCRPHRQDAKDFIIDAFSIPSAGTHKGPFSSDAPT